MDWRELVLIAVLVVVVVLARRRQLAEQQRMPSSREPVADAGGGEPHVVPHPEQVARIRVYLERYRDVYNIDALRRKLLSDGHDRRAVDAAMAEVFGQKVLPLARRERFYARWERADWLIFFGTLLFNGVALPALLATAIRDPASPAVLVNVLLIPLIVVVELAVASLIRKRFPAVHGVFWASLMYFAIFPVSLGTCLAIFNGVAG